MGASHDLEGVRNDADGHQLLAVVAAVHHQRVGEALNDGAVGLAEPLGGIATGGVGDVDGRPDLDVVAVKKKPVSLRSQQNSASDPRPQIATGPMSSQKLECCLTSGRCRGSRHPRSSSGLQLTPSQRQVPEMCILLPDAAVCRSKCRVHRSDVLKSLTLPTSARTSLGRTS